jgi:hypothetical protein
MSAKAINLAGPRSANDTILLGGSDPIGVRRKTDGLMATPGLGKRPGLECVLE